MEYFNEFCPLPKQNIEVTLNDKLENKVIDYRNALFSLYQDRFTEILINLLEIKGCDTIDYLKLNYLLLKGYNVVLGLNTFNNIVILGYTNANRFTSKLIEWLPVKNDFSKKDIKFLIEKKYRLSKYILISEQDNFSSGNCVILSNSVFNNFSDLRFIAEYSKNLAEIEGSRYSLEIQAKAVTYYLASSPKDENANSFIGKLFNSTPIIKVSDDYDFKNRIGTIDGASTVANNILTLKNDRNDRITELCEFLGIQTLSINKESGVSDVEAKSGNPFTSFNLKRKSNIYNQALMKLNKRFNMDIKVELDVELQDKPLESEELNEVESE